MRVSPWLVLCPSGLVSESGNGLPRRPRRSGTCSPIGSSSSISLSPANVAFPTSPRTVPSVAIGFWGFSTVREQPGKHREFGPSPQPPV